MMMRERASTPKGLSLCHGLLSLIFAFLLTIYHNIASLCVNIICVLGYWVLGGMLWLGASLPAQHVTLNDSS